ncbi:UNVERIFIED_CONTAM: hypothetical protein RMT77_002438 [Armadillidium vulgare]
MNIKKEMDRKGTRGSKPKNLPPKDLFALGSKSSNNAGIPRNSSSLQSSVPSSSESGPSQIGLEKSVHSASYAKSTGSGVDRGRDAAAAVLMGKKTGGKPPYHPPGALARHGPQKVTPGDVTEEWEAIAEQVETDDLIPLLEAAEEREDIEKIEAYLCGTVKVLRSQRMKPDNILCLTLTYLAKVKPSLFNSVPVIDAFCSLLRKNDFGMTFKAKTNPSASVLAANILLAVFQDEKCWQENFIKAYIDDSLGERLWVDHEDCKGFVDNIIASFKTKMPAKSSLYPDHGPTRPDCPSPLSATSGLESGDGDSELSLECKESVDSNVYNRYAHMTSEVEEMVIEAVQHQLNLRLQNVDAVARNFIRFLSTVTGIIEVRKLVAPKLETWLQNHKHQRPAIELLMSMCLNCNTHSPIDQKVISFIVHIRIKLKPLTNQYMSCLRELLSAHPDNIASVLKETTFNELSPSRNVSNMAILSVVFQYAPEQAALILADIFLELLRNADDFLRALRALLREIVRSLRHDMQFQKFCQGLMKEQKDPTFKDTFEHKDRMFHSIVDLIVLTMFVSISPQVRDATNMMYRGENRDIELVKRYQESVSLVQQDALYWMYRVVPKSYAPVKEEYIKSLHKILMMDQPEVYYHKDNWPTDGDRPLFFRLSSEVPLKEDALHHLLLIGVMKEQYIKPQEVLELTDKIIKRATSLNFEHLEMLSVSDTNIINLIFNLCPYMPPENSPLPPNYRPPKTAIVNLYWKAWTIFLLITAHNPRVFGVLAWDSYPTLRVIMEMCITNSFIFPPPTMAIGDKGEELINQELLLSSRERQQILEFESHLAQKTITEQNSLLLSQLITMEPKGPARKPPLFVMELLKTLNASNKIGHLLCRCRKPDFLVDIIQRQGAPQSMPWLAQLVESSEDAFSVLPVQCLCEFLLSETVVTPEGAVVTRHQQLLQHLRCLLLSPRQGEDVSVEILEYFLRRLSSQQPGARTQAVRGLQLVVGPLTESMEAEPDKHEPYRWLIKHLPNLPGFPMIRGGACQALRAACQIETKPSAVSAYIRFLAFHTCEDSLQDMSALVQDMAQLIVERSTMISAILPSPSHSGSTKFPHANATLNALFIIFINYMQGARIPSRDLFAAVENQDHVRIQWATGEQAVMHILVVHAMVILLISGPSASSDLFQQLLSIWFPENQEMPQAFLVDTAQEALLLPDWLKLKMIRSTVPQLVDAALKDLEPSQLVLFIQSFGIPVASMTKLLCALDLAVSTNEEAVAAAVLDKSHKNYMAQLVEVQHQRGARGGHAFAVTLGERDDLDRPSEERPPFKPLITPLKTYGSFPIELSTSEVQSFILQCYTCSALHVDHKKQVMETMRTLQQHLSKEISSIYGEKYYLNELLRSLSAILQSSVHSKSFIIGLQKHSTLSAPLFRLLLQMKDKGDCSHLYTLTVQVVNAILHLSPKNDSLLNSVLHAFTTTTQTATSRLSEPVALTDLSTEIKIFEKLSRCATSELERLIRDLVELAMREGKIHLVVKAMVLMLTKLREENASSLTGQRVALLLDWLLVLDPELHFIEPKLSKILLFGLNDNQDLNTLMLSASTSGSQVKKESLVTTRVGYNQAYLLAAFTHQATWETLESTIHELLKNVDLNLHPRSILDFVWAVLHVPKLWQGRERRCPRHVRTKMPLKLNSSELIHLTEYILTECKKHLGQSESNAMIQKRIKLLFYCLPDSSFDMRDIVKHLNLISKSQNDSQQSDCCSHLLYQMYLKRPCIIKYFGKQNIVSMLKIQEMASNQGQSAADASLHTLLTMLTSPLPEKEFLKRMYDLEAAVRKMAAEHPLLVVRHLSLLAATLQGLTHLHWSVFLGKNYMDLFTMVMGILELLQPYIFYSKYVKPFSKTVDAYIELFEKHGERMEIRGLLVRTCHLLMGWVGSRGGSALSCISRHSSLLSLLLENHPDILPLRSLAALAASKGSDHPKEDKSDMEIISIPNYADEPYLHDWLRKQSRELLLATETYKTAEEQGEILQKLQNLNDSSSGRLLVPFFHFISESLLSHDYENRRKSWNLLVCLLKRKPKMAHQVYRSVLSVLNSEDVSVASMGVRQLSKIILMLHEYSPDLLTAGFNVCLYSGPEVTNALSESLFLLTINTGA